MLARAKFNLARWLLRGMGYSVVRIVAKGREQYVVTPEGQFFKIGRK